MNSSEIVRCLELVRKLKEKVRPERLTPIEYCTMHLMREFGFLYIDHGNEGTEDAVIRCWADSRTDENYPQKGD